MIKTEISISEEIARFISFSRRVSKYDSQPKPVTGLKSPKGFISGFFEIVFSIGVSISTGVS